MRGYSWLKIGGDSVGGTRWLGAVRSFYSSCPLLCNLRCLGVGAFWLLHCVRVVVVVAGMHIAVA